jgi:hypothetical protein
MEAINITKEEVAVVFNQLTDTYRKVEGVNYARYRHVDKIDNIEVNIIMEYSSHVKYYYLMYSISADCVYEDQYDENSTAKLFHSYNFMRNGTSNLTEEKVRSLMEDIETTTTMLTFNKRLCVFLPYKRENENKNAIRGQKCCVCYDVTKGTTNCKHEICLECFQKLPTRVCPICNETEPLFFTNI